jgi:hypothetical protein
MQVLRLEGDFDTLHNRSRLLTIALIGIPAVISCIAFTATPAVAAGPDIPVIIRSAITGGEAFYWMPTAAMQRIPVSIGNEASVVLKPSSGFTDLIIGARQFEDIGVGYEASSFLVNVGSRSMSWRIFPAQVLEIPAAVGSPGTMVQARIGLEELGLGAVIEVDYTTKYGLHGIRP